MDLSHPLVPWPMLATMNPLASFTMLIATAQSLVAAVTTRDNLHLRPQFARNSVAARLRSGMIVLRAYLRRLIILIALDMEWHLADKRGVMKRPHGRKAKSSMTKFALRGLDGDKVSPWLNGAEPQFKAVIKTDHSQPIPINMTKLYAQLDFLSKIASNPAAKAKRLAFHLARTREGIILAPEGPKRIAGRWGTQISAFYSTMAHTIITKSRNRPPPLTPLRTHWPTITAL